MNFRLTLSQVFITLSISFTIFSQQEPKKAHYAVCDEIKHLDPNGAESVYAAFVAKMQQQGLDSCKCGLYILNRKFSKAYQQLTTENKLSKDFVENMMHADFAYTRRPSALEVELTMDASIEPDLAEHIIETMHTSQQLRDVFYTPVTSKLTSSEPEKLIITVTWPRYTIRARSRTVESSRALSSIGADTNKKSPENKIEIDITHRSTNQKKGAFNHEYAHYFFGDGSMRAFLRMRNELIKPKNGFQKLLFAQEYRADWFLGLISRSNKNLAYSQEHLTDPEGGFNDIEHPASNKRMSWISRWLKLKRAELSSSPR